VPVQKVGRSGVLPPPRPARPFLPDDKAERPDLREVGARYLVGRVSTRMTASKPCRCRASPGTTPVCAPRHAPTRPRSPRTPNWGSRVGKSTPYRGGVTSASRGGQVDRPGCGRSVRFHSRCNRRENPPDDPDLDHLPRAGRAHDRCAFLCIGQSETASL